MIFETDSIRVELMPLPPCFARMFGTDAEEGNERDTLRRLLGMLPFVRGTM